MCMTEHVAGMNCKVVTRFIWTEQETVLASGSKQNQNNTDCTISRYIGVQINMNRTEAKISISIAKSLNQQNYS